jgi:8-oxo-dGTP pyrophosphatase MutT (NUDIX family)
MSQEPKIGGFDPVFLKTATMEKVIPQAGAICLVDGQVVLVTNKSGTRWVIPKGHMEPNDPDEGFRAVQEAWEEAGVNGELVTDSPGSFPYSKRARDYRVQVFLLRNCTLSDTWPESKMRKRVLVSPIRAAEMVREPDLQNLFRALAD